MEAGGPIHFNTLKASAAAHGLSRENRRTASGAVAMTAIKEQLDYRNEVMDRQLAHVEPVCIARAYDRRDYYRRTDGHDAGMGRLPGCAGARRIAEDAVCQQHEKDWSALQGVAGGDP